MRSATSRARSGTGRGSCRRMRARCRLAARAPGRSRRASTSAPARTRRSRAPRSRRRPRRRAGRDSTSATFKPGGCNASIARSTPSATASSRPRQSPRAAAPRRTRAPTSRRRAAPSDARTAISPIRAAPRANIRFARFTQPISRIVAVAAKNIASGVRAQPGLPALAARARTRARGLVARNASMSTPVGAPCDAASGRLDVGDDRTIRRVQRRLALARS